MKRLLILLYLFGCQCYLSVASDESGSPRTPKPNIIFILVDDLGYGDLGCYGQEKIMTPNIDELANEGMRFTQAYSGSCVCAPSRCSLITGMHNGHNRVRDNLPHGIYLRPDDFTIAELLKQAGYKTGGIGKWGLGVPGTWGLPHYQGFDYWYGHLHQDHHFYYPECLWQNDEVVLLQEVVMENEIGLLKGNRGDDRRFYTQDLFTEKAIDYIKTNQDVPFFLYLSYTIPHFSTYPKDTPEHFIVPSDAPYSDKDWTQLAKNYAAMITMMDHDVGDIVSLVRDLGIEENTVIFFSSDNGPYQGVPEPVKFFNSNGALKGGKRDLNEGGIRVPFIVKWKGIVEEGSVSEKIITFWDMMSTFADLTGYPEEPRSDGKSILPVMKGEPSGDHEYLYWDYGHVRASYQQAVRMGKYKGIHHISAHSHRFDLYDLDEDPSETNNIAMSNPEIVSMMKRIMAEAYQNSEDFPRRGF